jgi:hypothetical protein
MDVKARVADLIRRRHEISELHAAEVDRRAKAVETCITKIVKPAFQEFEGALRPHGRQVTVYASATEATIIVTYEKAEELNYGIRVDDEDNISALVRDAPAFMKHPQPWVIGFDPAQGEVTVEDLTCEQVLKDLLMLYEAGLSFHG